MLKVGYYNALTSTWRRALAVLVCSQPCVYVIAQSDMTTMRLARSAVLIVVLANLVRPCSAMHDAPSMHVAPEGATGLMRPPTHQR